MLWLVASVCELNVPYYLNGTDFIIKRTHGTWTAWNHGSSMTTCYRRHLQGYHKEEWAEVCKSGNLKQSQALLSSDAQSAWIPFTLEMFYHLLLKWIAVDDQVCRV